MLVVRENDEIQIFIPFLMIKRKSDFSSLNFSPLLELKIFANFSQFDDDFVTKKATINEKIYHLQRISSKIIICQLWSTKFSYFFINHYVSCQLTWAPRFVSTASRKFEGEKEDEELGENSFLRVWSETFLMFSDRDFVSVRICAKLELNLHNEQWRRRRKFSFFIR